MTAEQIQRFLNKSCTVTEAAAVSAFLNNNPRIAEQYISKEEWDAISETFEMPEAFWESSWISIQKKRKAKIVSLWVKRISVAACLAGLLYTGIALFIINKKTSRSVIATIKEVKPVIAEEKIITNTDAKNRMVVLEDNSVILLSPNATIKYFTPFQNNRRDIKLDGTAYFKVAKNKEKPFTVYAGSLATTALGTEFSVTTQNKNITVKLFNGKVVIRSVDKNPAAREKDIYLLPGQQMQYNAASMLATTGSFTADKIVKKNGLKKNTPVTSLSFKNTPMNEVLEKLAARYNVKIMYDKTRIAGKNFTGNIEAEDSLSVVLKVIAQMNDLDITAFKKGFNITVATTDTLKRE
ncbi:FecR domain-containing protein [soil metagenome]